MQCQFWEAECKDGKDFECDNYARCRSGWVPFWDKAEIAGLKAMGNALRTFRPMSEYPTLEDGLRAHRGIIRTYVQAVRRSRGI